MTAEPAAQAIADDLARQLVELVGDLLCACHGGRIVWINPAGAAMLGREADALTGTTLAGLLHPDHAASLAGDLEQLVTAEPIPLLFRRADGTTVATIVTAQRLDDGTITLHARDLTASFPAAESLVAAVNRMEQRARDLARLSRQNTLSARVFETASEAIVVLDADMRITAVNPAYCEITGYSPAEVIGRKHPALTDRDGDIAGAMLMFDTARSTGRWQGEAWSRRKDGGRYAERIGLSWLADEDGRHCQFVMVFSDITARKLDEEHIRRQANYDSLTGLPNRALFLDRLNQAVRNAERSDHMIGLMFIDLDGFKLVNDTLGHDMGDLLLQEAGHRLAHCVRAGDTVARMGGDEFTVLMPNLGNYQNAPAVAGRILEALRKPFDLTGKEAFVTGSIGITVYPGDARDAATMLKNADAAMYRAKEHGKANFQFFTADMNAAIEERLAIKNGLLKAFDRNELDLHFQPKLDLKTRAITGVEALLRWQAADLGMVSPSKFIPVMEETGLIGSVGAWAIDAACRQYRQWRDAGLSVPRVAINLSVRQLRAPGFVELVQDAMDRAGIGGDGIEFEITEGMVMKDSDNAVAVLRRLSAMGVRLAMDDFGTGYSSLSVLKRFPVDSIKIDRTFISDIGTDADSFEIIRTIISMGHSLRRRIIAEGVETSEQLAALETLGCDEIQGYILAPPLPRAELEAYLRNPPHI